MKSFRKPEGVGRSGKKKMETRIKEIIRKKAKEIRVRADKRNIRKLINEI